MNACSNSLYAVQWSLASETRESTSSIISAFFNHWNQMWSFILCSCDTVLVILMQQTFFYSCVPFLNKCRRDSVRLSGSHDADIQKLYSDITTSSDMEHYYYLFLGIVTSISVSLGIEFTCPFLWMITDAYNIWSAYKKGIPLTIIRFTTHLGTPNAHWFSSAPSNKRFYGPTSLTLTEAFELLVILCTSFFLQFILTI